MKIDTKPYEEKMQKSVAVYRESLTVIRAGRANTAVLKGIEVSYYGTPTPINQMAEIKATDPRTLSITPWDMTTLKDIEKAILASDVGITPVNDGKTIRLAFPQLTEERRKELTKQISKMGEEAKVAIRNIRRSPRNLRRISPTNTSKRSTRLPKTKKKRSWRSDLPIIIRAPAGFKELGGSYFFCYRKYSFGVSLCYSKKRVLKQITIVIK